MKSLRLAATGMALCTIAGCADGRGAPAPTAPALSDRAPAAASSAPARRVDASGSFDAIVDFSSFTFTPRGRNCLLTVNGRLELTGTIEGTATGQTTALVFAPCSEVATAAPGTFRDVFHSELVFEGTVDGEPAQANVLYAGRVQEGGEIEGRLIFSNGVAGALDVDAVVAVGGDYRGSVVVR